MKPKRITWFDVANTLSHLTWHFIVLQASPYLCQCFTVFAADIGMQWNFQYGRLIGEKSCQKSGGLQRVVAMVALRDCVRCKFLHCIFSPPQYTTPTTSLLSLTSFPKALQPNRFWTDLHQLHFGKGIVLLLWSRLNDKKSKRRCFSRDLFSRKFNRPHQLCS